MKAIIVEDSRLAREGLKKLLESFSQIHVVAEAGNADTGFKLISDIGPDVVFLDIDMPGKNGFELLTELQFSPPVIFTTAFSEYAARSFDFNTVDYLLKPINPQRLTKAIKKLEELTLSEKRSGIALDETSQVFVKDGEESFLIALAQIRWFESCGNYTRLHFTDASPFVYKSLSRVEERLPENMFFRVNRKQIVNLRFVKNVVEEVSGSYSIVMSDGEEIKVSRSHSSRLRSIYSL